MWVILPVLYQYLFSSTSAAFGGTGFYTGILKAITKHFSEGT